MESTWTLFVSALISSTLLPGGSEALLAYQITQQPSAALELVLIATLGNGLGSLITFGMGWAIAHFFPLRALSKPMHQRAQAWLNRFGPWVLLLAWLPVIGDPLCLLAGWLKLNPTRALVAIFVGKFARFAVVGLLALQTL